MTSKANFKKKANNITQQPSAAAWEKLAKKLEEPKKSKSVRKFSIFAFAAAASIAVIFGLFLKGGYFSMEKQPALANVEVESKTVSHSRDRKAVASSGLDGLQQLPQNPYENFYEKVAAARQNGLLERYSN